MKGEQVLAETPKDHEGLLNLLMQKDSITWKAILQELVKSEEMDPWDIDVSELVKAFISVLRKLQHMDVHVSGKVVLAAALLLKIKSTRLIGADLSRLDSLFASSDDEEYDDGFFTEFGDEFGQHFVGKGKLPTYGLIPRTPQPRKRKMSIYDLMDALQQAMEVKRRRLARYLPEDVMMKIPGKTVDISQLIREMYTRIKMHFTSDQGQLMFHDLVGDGGKEEIVYTFVPLLHLTNQRKIDLTQEKNFGPIEITKPKKTESTAQKT